MNAQSSTINSKNNNDDMMTNLGSKDKKKDEVENKYNNEGKNKMKGKDENDRKSSVSYDLCESITVKGEQ